VIHGSLSGLRPGSSSSDNPVSAILFIFFYFIQKGINVLLDKYFLNIVTGDDNAYIPKNTV
jgi:hypothetical protein